MDIFPYLNPIFIYLWARLQEKCTVVLTYSLTCVCVVVSQRLVQWIIISCYHVLSFDAEIILDLASGSFKLASLTFDMSPLFF